MQAVLKIAKGNLIREAAENSGKISASVIVSKEKLHEILGAEFCSDLGHCAKNLEHRLNLGEVICTVLVYAQDPENPKDSLDHLAVQFVLNYPK